MGEVDAKDDGISTRSRYHSPWVYFVRVCSFTFEFHSLEQIEICLAYYSSKTHPSSLVHGLKVPSEKWGCDHWETQRWFERLPEWLMEESKRRRVVKALTTALSEFKSESEAA